jgi:hypothetical protein
MSPLKKNPPKIKNNYKELCTRFHRFAKMSHDGSQNVVLIRILFPLDGLPHFWKANGSLIFLAVRKPLEANNQHTKIQQKKQHTQKKNYQLHSRMQTLTRPAKKNKKKHYYRGQTTTVFFITASLWEQHRHSRSLISSSVKNSDMQSPMVKLLRVRGTRICSSHHE